MRAFWKVVLLLKSLLLGAPFESWFAQTGCPLSLGELCVPLFGLPGVLFPSHPHCLSGSTFGVRSTTVESAKMMTRCAPTYGVRTALSASAIGLETCAARPTTVRKNFGDPPSV